MYDIINAFMEIFKILYSIHVLEITLNYIYSNM